MNIRSAIEEIAVPVVADKQCELVGVEVVAGQAKQRSTVNVYVDNAAGIGVDTCSEIARELGHIMDVELPNFDSYVLSVSSPGMDRRFFKIEQLANYIGETIKVKLLTPIAERKNIKGRLDGVSGSEFVIMDGEQSYTINFAETEKVKLVPDYAKILSSSKHREAKKS